MNAEEIRSLYIEALARAEFEHVMHARSRYGDYLSPSNAKLRWETLAEGERQIWRSSFAERWVAALAERGLLPTRRRTRFGTVDGEVAIVEEFVTPGREVVSE